MMTAAANMMKLWFWPWEAAQTIVQAIETAAATQAVLAVRLPMLSDAWIDPSGADHRELSLMVSEKVEAFGRSGRSMAKAGGVVRRAVDENARALGRATGGGVLTPLDWMGIVERNLLVAATLMALPMRTWAPLHEGVTRNARRLGRR